MDRRKNKIVAFRISKNNDKIDNAVCRRLLNDVIYNNNSNYKLKNKINVITTDGNWSYTRLIKCNYRKISSLKKVKQKIKIVNETTNEIKEKVIEKTKRYKKNNKVIKEVKEKYYNGFTKETINQNSRYDNCVSLMNYLNYNFIDCNIHIVDKSETCLVESNNSNIRSNLARFNRRTKAFSRDITSIEDAMYLYVYKDKIQNNILRYANLGRVV